MTYGIRRTSVGEERLVRFLRICDYVFFWGFGMGVVGEFGWRNVQVLGLGVTFVTFGAAAKLIGVVVAYLVMSSRTPNAEIAPWIRQWTRTTSVITCLAAIYALIAGPDPAVRLLGLAVAVVCVLLFRRVGSLTIGELDTRWGPYKTSAMFTLGFFGPEITAWLTAGWLVLAIVVRVSMPSLFRPNQQKVHPDELKMRVLAVVNAESRYHRVHGSYSSDIVELRRLGSSLIDSLVVVTADDRSYRAIARDPGGGVSCGLWSAARIGERTPLQIEGVGPDQPVCWTAPDSAKKAR